MTFGLIVGSIMTLICSMCFAEICSAYPMNGSVFSWSKFLSFNKNSREVSFYVGSLYIFGLVTALSACTIAAASFTSSTIQINHPNY